MSGNSPFNVNLARGLLAIMTLCGLPPRQVEIILEFPHAPQRLSVDANLSTIIPSA